MAAGNAAGSRLTDPALQHFHSSPPQPCTHWYIYIIDIYIIIIYYLLFIDIIYAIYII